MSLHQLLVACMLLFFLWINLTPLFAIIPNCDQYVSGMGVVLFLGIANILNSTLCIATNILNFSKHYSYSLLFISLLTAAAIGLNLWLIPLLGVTGSACATLLAYIIYFVPLLTLLWSKLRITLFSRKQLWVVLFTLALFGLNGLWDWLLSPLFAPVGSGLAIVLIQAVVRTLLFAAIAYMAIARMHISPEVDKLLRLKTKQ
ncbi:MAG: polysaccharide biosynthesis C-terminal domain-containing protein [Bacteroidales bacterium]|nr:polysaccharide biosynthesis C-terminal domain-containing protein [Bacteroidales bacterium]